ncbi:MAG: ATP-binding protein [Bacteroidia bacterium]|nr:ATP-binding protein [Bacteroidia bacterium]
MSKLMDSLDFYKDFNLKAHFVSTYNCFPSSLELEIPLEENKENMEKVLSGIDFQKYDIKLLFKRWWTKDHKDAKQSEDYADRYFFASQSKSLMITVKAYNEDISVDFFFDHSDKELENWVLQENHRLRSLYGKEKTPTFKILTYKNDNFGTEEVNTKLGVPLDLEQLYNDDFQEVDEIISNSFSESHSGLILFHGLPGTGKTTYIKDLIRRFQKKSFIFIQNEFVKSLLKPQFISFLMRHRNSVLVIEDAEKVISSRESGSDDSVVSTILQLTDGLFSDYLNIKVICTFNTSIDKIDKALMRKGRLIAKYEFKPLSVAKTISLLESLGHKGRSKEMSLAEIFNLNSKTFNGDNGKKAIGFVRG